MIEEPGILCETDADNVELARSVVAATLAAVDFLQPMERREAPILCYLMLRDEIGYKAEMGTQRIRMPWRLVADGVGDCKSQSVFTASLCARSGCRVTLRFVQLPGADHLGHVYTVVDGVAIDPLLPYGKECAYIRAVDVPIS